MPIYEFESPCGATLSTCRPMTANTQSKTCPCCNLEARRIYSNFSFHRFPEHFNPAVGKTVSSQQGFKDDLKRASEEATRNTGIEHNFVPMEMPTKREELPGTESQWRHHRKKGTPGFERKTLYFT